LRIANKASSARLFAIPPDQEKTLLYVLSDQFQIKTQKMTTADRKVILELNEHDAMRLLVLIETALNEADKVWQGYWERLAQQVKQGIEQSGFEYKPDLNCSTTPDAS
jgi:hypothetical protein